MPSVPMEPASVVSTETTFGSLIRQLLSCVQKMKKKLKKFPQSHKNINIKNYAEKANMLRQII